MTGPSNPRLGEPAGPLAGVIAGAFDSNWAEELKTQTDGDLKDAVDSIVNNRNLIAHGAQISLSFFQLQDYYRRMLKVLDLVEARCTT